MPTRDEYWLLVRDLETGKVAKMIRIPDLQLEAYALSIKPREVDCRD
jgi:hypothetical protein